MGCLRRDSAASVEGAPAASSRSGPGAASADARILGGQSAAANSESKASALAGGSGGLCGLSNLGNTCFMNAALQCLSHTHALSEFFLQGEWKADLNTSNVLGSGGALAKEYAALLSQLWHGTKPSVTPASFKRVISKFASQFAGYEQHDAQELTAFLLDGLHEDLNRCVRQVTATSSRTGTRHVNAHVHVHAHAYAHAHDMYMYMHMYMCMYMHM